MMGLPFPTTLLTPMAPFPQPGTQSDNDAAHDNDGDHYADDPTDYRRLGEGLHDPNAAIACINGARTAACVSAQPPKRSKSKATSEMLACSTSRRISG